ncbi:hypothetical protein L6R53_15240 [Myxococcota bacterium]|nr:hypothetical protein [Myxococcota bacterium]
MSSPDPAALLAQALETLAQDGAAAALPLLDAALAAQPTIRHGETGGRVTRGLVRMELGLAAEAAEDFKAWTAQDPQDAAGWLGLGRARAALRDAAGAVQALDRAIDLRPGWSDAHWHRATSRASLHELAGAVEDLDAALRHLPPWAMGTAREARICVARAQLRLLVEDRAGAREDLVRAAAVHDARGDLSGRDGVIAMARELGL